MLAQKHETTLGGNSLRDPARHEQFKINSQSKTATIFHYARFEALVVDRLLEDVTAFNTSFRPMEPSLESLQVTKSYTHLHIFKRYTRQKE